MAERGAQQLIGRVIGGRFEVVAPIGRGRFTLMVAAKDLQADSPDSAAAMVALKLLPISLASDESFVRRFRHEVRAAAAIDHPNVVSVKAWGDEGQLFVVNEFVAGGSLRALMNSGRSLSPEQAAVIAVDASRGLDQLHRRGLIHRTIRPSNILLRPDGHAAISDVGLGWLIEEQQGDDQLDFRYMAPEMAGSEADAQPIDGRLDVYALALSLIEAVDGAIPLLGSNLGQTLTYRTDHDVPMSARWGAVGRPLAKAAHRLATERSKAGDLEIGLMAVADQFQGMGAIEPVGVFNAAGSEPPLSEVTPTFVPVSAGGAPAGNDAESGPETGAVSVQSVEPDDDAPRVVRRRRVPVEPEIDTTKAETAEPEQGRGARNWMTAVAAILILGTVAAVLRLVVFAPSGEVPVLVGRDLQVAKLEAKKNGWKLDYEAVVRKDGTEVDEVVDQSPDPGVELEPGQRLRITVSLGPTLVPFSNPEGQKLDAATKTLEAAGFKAGKVTRQFDEKVPKESVIHADAKVDAAGSLAKGTIVNLVVSDGPAPRKIPAGLPGKPEAEAVDAVVSVQLKAVVERKSDAKIAAGIVISVSPAEGKEVARDSSVKIVVSSGKPPVLVPFVGGQPLILVQDAITKAGLVVGEVVGPPIGTAAGTEPAAGTPVPPGTKIKVVLQ